MSPVEQEQNEAVARVHSAAERLAKGRRRRPSLFRYLGHVGVLGWVFVLPVVAFMALGHLLGQRLGSIAPALVGGALGMAAGAYGVWRALSRDLTGDDERENQDRERREQENEQGHEEQRAAEGHREEEP